jgi:hypothetical protein
MKQIIVILRDGSQMCHKIVPDDFDVEEWTEKRKHHLPLLGIERIVVETIEMSDET